MVNNTRGYCVAAVLMSLLIGVPVSAPAADSGFYIGLDEGWVKYPGSAMRQIGTTTLTGTDLDDTSFTYDFTAGYRFNRYFSLEAGYVDLGQRSGLLRGFVGDTGALGNSSFSAKGETLIAIATLPFGKWDFSLKAGILRADAHLDFSGSVSDERYVSHLMTTNTHPLYGLGVGYNLDSHWRIQSGWTTYREVGSTRDSGFRIAGPNITTLTLGIAFRF
jgi:OmpA-like transmembrane domain